MEEAGKDPTEHVEEIDKEELGSEASQSDDENEEVDIPEEG